ncbi:hypothetical protein YC2023_047565 [Brassica napus]
MKKQLAFPDSHEDNDPTSPPSSSFIIYHHHHHLFLFVPSLNHHLLIPTGYIQLLLPFL